MRNAMENMMDDMGADVMVDRIEPAIIVIHCGQSPFEKIPILASIPRNVGVGMVQKGD